VTTLLSLTIYLFLLSKTPIWRRFIATSLRGLSTYVVTGHIKKKKRSEEKAERAQAKLIHCRIRIPAMDHQDGMSTLLFFFFLLLSLTIYLFLLSKTPIWRRFIATSLRGLSTSRKRQRERKRNSSTVELESPPWIIRTV
jgi:hypothetical protein